MEREPIRQAQDMPMPTTALPGELTGAAQNTYPNNMPDGGSPDIGPTPDSGAAQAQVDQSTISDAQIAQARRVAEDADTPEHLRAAASDWLSSLGPRAQARAPQAEGSRSSDERANRTVQNMLRRGGVDIPKPVFNPDEFSDPTLRQYMGLIRDKKDLVNDPEAIEDVQREFDNFVRSAPPEIREEMDKFQQKIEEAKDYISAKGPYLEKQSESTYSLYLDERDIEMIREDETVWMRNLLDDIYRYSIRGSEERSAMVQQAQQKHERAVSLLKGTDKMLRDPKRLIRFTDEFNSRLYSMFARSAIQQKNMEGIGGIAGSLGTHGIMYSLSNEVENGLINRMHNRINELYDDIRVTLPNQHITPEVHAMIQKRVSDEYIKLLKTTNDPHLFEELGIKGLVSDIRKEALARDAVSRIVGSAYDHFVASQREAVLVARGNALDNSINLKGILADPSGLFNMFNIEQLLVAKFGTLNEEQQHFFQAIKRRYAESVLAKKKDFNLQDWVKKRLEINPHIEEHEIEHAKAAHKKPDITRAALEDYGAELIRDIMQVNDWYSSGWKLDEYMAQIDQNMMYRIAKQRPGIKSIFDLSEADKAEAKRRADEFGLFMRLRDIQNGSRYNGTDKDAERRKVWAKIAKYKPEDVVRMYREHGDHHGHEMEEVNRAFAEAGIIVTPHDKANGIHTPYDKFKAEYGPALRLIRELGYSNLDENGNERLPEQIDFSQIMSNQRYADLLNNSLNDPQAAQKIATLYTKLQTFANSKIGNLMTESRFHFVNLRTFSVDDGLLDRMEQENLDMGLTALSKKLSPESGGDAYKRTFNDATAAAEAYKQLLTFVSEENGEAKLKAALAAAAAVKGYRDPGVAALTFRYTYGSYMLMGAVAEKGKSPWYTLYETLDWKQKLFNKPINELQEIYGPLAPAFNNDDLWQFLQHHKTDLVGSGAHGHEHFEEMERLARVRTKDRAKLRGYRFLIFMMLWILWEGYNTTTTTVKEGLKSEDI